jgi:hypothetical protein
MATKSGYSWFYLRPPGLPFWRPAWNPDCGHVKRSVAKPLQGGSRSMPIKVTRHTRSRAPPADRPTARFASGPRQTSPPSTSVPTGHRRPSAPEPEDTRTSGRPVRQTASFLERQGCHVGQAEYFAQSTRNSTDDCGGIVSPDANHSFRIYGLPRSQSWTGELLSGYHVCPADCEVLEFFNERTLSEISKATCPQCRRHLESVVERGIFF